MVMASAPAQEVCQQFVDEEDDGILTELQLLEAIYVNELTFSNDLNGKPQYLEVLLHPSTADDPEKQYVCLTLSITLNQHYPHEVPGIDIRNPRGLPDEEILSLLQTLRKHAEENINSPMLYELIEICKELLTESNIPHCPCIICLDHFHSDTDFTKTPCYHYLHTHCMYKYITYFHENVEEEDNLTNSHNELKKEKKEIVCPVCREPITACVNEALQNPIAVQPEDTIEYKPDENMIKLQKKMAKMLKIQKSKGGIIDIDKESKKYLLEEGTTVMLSKPELLGNKEMQNNTLLEERSRRKLDSGRKEVESGITNTSRRSGSQSYKSNPKIQTNARHGKSELCNKYKNDRSRGCESEVKDCDQKKLYDKKKEFDSKKFREHNDNYKTNICEKKNHSENWKSKNERSECKYPDKSQRNYKDRSDRTKQFYSHAPRRTYTVNPRSNEYQTDSIKDKQLKCEQDIQNEKSSRRGQSSHLHVGNNSPNNGVKRSVLLPEKWMAEDSIHDSSPREFVSRTVKSTSRYGSSGRGVDIEQDKTSSNSMTDGAFVQDGCVDTKREPPRGRGHRRPTSRGYGYSRRCFNNYREPKNIVNGHVYGDRKNNDRIAQSSYHGNQNAKHFTSTNTEVAEQEGS